MSFKNRWTISSSYDFQANQQRSQRRSCFSQTALLWFEVLTGLSSALPDLSPVLPGALRLVVGAPRLVAGAPRCSQVHPKFSPALRGVPKPITITPVAVIRDPSYSEGRPECPPRVWHSPEIDASQFTLHILSDTPGVFQWLKYILLMYIRNSDANRTTWHDC